MMLLSRILKACIFFNLSLCRIHSTIKDAESNFGKMIILELFCLSIEIITADLFCSLEVVR